MNTETLTIQNDGPEIRATDWWQTAAAQGGKCYLSVNAGALRLLLPAGPVGRFAAELAAARECVVSKGFWPEAMGVGLELLFEDSSDEPIGVWLDRKSMDRMPGAEDVGRELVLTVWADGCEKVAEMGAKIRQVEEIPFMAPWEK